MPAIDLKTATLVTTAAGVDFTHILFGATSQSAVSPQDYQLSAIRDKFFASIAVGSGYVGVETPPTDGALFQGYVAIGGNSATQPLDVYGVIYARSTIELGHATDTTLSRVSAGVAAIEGKNIYLAGGADVALADGGTGASLTDPNADRIMFWDDSAGAVDWLTVSTGLTISGTTLTASGGKGVDQQIFTSSGTWTKPSGYSTSALVRLQAWGGGGGGGRHSTSAAGGGGGGGYNEKWVLLSDMGATETITIGGGGAGRSTNGTGTVGGNTTIGSLLTAYGGGGGITSYGGGGGGFLGAGGSGPGLPYLMLSATDLGYQGTYTTQGYEWWGFFHGGGGGAVSAAGYGGGFSFWGGGGGGGSGIVVAAGSSIFGGAGGAGSSTGTAGNGTQPGGGGGGTKSGTSGSGGDGQVVITVFDHA